MCRDAEVVSYLELRFQHHVEMMSWYLELIFQHDVEISVRDTKPLLRLGIFLPLST